MAGILWQAGDQGDILVPSCELHVIFMIYMPKGHVWDITGF